MSRASNAAIGMKRKESPPKSKQSASIKQGKGKHEPLTDSPSKQRRTPLARASNGQVLSGFSDEIAATVCERLTAGEHLSHICASEDMPSCSMFHRWMNARPDLREAYRHAREAQAQHWAHQVVEIADESALTSEDINRARLRVDARKWVASKLIPRVYGDRVQTEIGRPGEFEAIDSARLLAEAIAARLGSPKLLEAQAVDIVED